MQNIIKTLNSKPETLNKPETQNPKRYDLGDRTFNFAKRIINYVHKLPKAIANIEIGRQLIKAAGSVGANYIEAEECLSKKDFVMRIKIARKEAKESRYWLMLSEPEESRTEEKEGLRIEATELLKIFGAILAKSK